MGAGALTLGGFLILLLSIGLTHLLAKDRELQKARREARAKAKFALSELHEELLRRNHDPHFVLTRHSESVDLALRDYRSQLSPRAARHLDECINRYQSARNRIQPGFLVYAECEVTGSSDSILATNELEAVLRELLQRVTA